MHTLFYSMDEENPESLIHERVTSDDIARVVARMTGIPVRVRYITQIELIAG